MGRNFIKFGLTKSKMEKYLRCGFAYDQHYNKKCRPIKDGSALMFGIAIDDMLNALLLGEEKEKCLKLFKEVISRYPLGSIIISKTDFDNDIIPDKRRETAQNYLKTKFKISKPMKEVFNEIYEKQKDKKKLTKKEEKVIDYIARVSLITKSEIILDAYEEQIIPHIKKVHAVQKASEQGILDLKADWDKKGNTYIIDNKTAGKEYEEKAADYSVQLILYAIEEECDQIMFIVIPKNISKNTTKTCKSCGAECNTRHQKCNEQIDGKRCNGEFDIKVDLYIEIQIVKAKVTEQMKVRAKEIQSGIQKMIDSKQFVCNFANCDNQFGKPCQYRELYWKNSMEGLEVKK